MVPLDEGGAAAAPAPWWTTPIASAGAPDAAVASGPDESVVEPASVVEPDREPGHEPGHEPADAATVVMPAAAPAARTTVMPEPLPPASRPRALAAAAAQPVAALRHSSGRRVGIEARRPRTLVWVLAGVLVVIVLVGLFFVGQRLGGGAPVAVSTPTSTPSAAATPTAAPTPTPTAAAEITAMQSAGVHPWNTLFGGECLEPYDSPWAEEFTVADCGAAHTAQLVFRGAFGGDAVTVFPGEAELAAQINVLCSAVGLIDLTAAAAVADVQVQGSYPVTDEQWTAGERHYYCFVSRSSGEPLTGSLAGPGPTA
ncbi:hypothetical protein E3T55_14050 [Cryobacterium frigoriphilum]|uniref:Septum formation-related domain-containing protein n=1 Tax=Cryobacterium frigoriphilum TaxID=1259150 RepID=A0A4R8ZWU4_9MICO|nr:hypothetical protein E3T55_14050 [Cryobacterium frigoriphilum]